MPACLTRLLPAVRRPLPDSRNHSRLSAVGSARAAMLHAVADCAGLPAQQLQLKICKARTHGDLWALRSAAYHLIALQHCQTIAIQRIHQLLHLFEGCTTTQPDR